MEPIHQETHSKLVKSSHGEDTWYRIFKGTVRWPNSSDELQTAIVIFMQYKYIEEWEEAKSEKVIAFRKTAHILPEDLDRVVEAMKEVALE